MKCFYFLLLIHLNIFAEITRLPDEFFIVERFLSFASTFDVSTDLEPLATAKKQMFRASSCFEITKENGDLLATTKAHFLTLGTIAEVYDPKGNEIGRIHEEIFRILPWCEYKVYNHEGRIKAIAKMNFLGTDFYLTHPDDESILYATISRPLIKIIRDYWTVQIHDAQIFESGIIDPRLLITLAIYQTDKDNRDHYRKMFFDELRKEFEYFDEHRLEF